MTNIDFIIRLSASVLGFVVYIFTLRKALGKTAVKSNLFWLFLGYLLILEEVL
jgi:hypothetical protein